MLCTRYFRTLPVVRLPAKYPTGARVNCLPHYPVDDEDKTIFIDSRTRRSDNQSLIIIHTASNKYKVSKLNCTSKITRVKLCSSWSWVQLSLSKSFLSLEGLIWNSNTHKLLEFLYLLLTLSYNQIKFMRT